MASPADRFTPMQKVAVFLIAIGQEQTRRFLSELDLATVERINGAIASLGPVAADEKASVMIEFADFFYRDKPLPMPAPGKPTRRKSRNNPPSRRKEADPPQHTLSPIRPPRDADPAHKQPAQAEPQDAQPQKAEEDALLDTLDQLRKRVDPGKIDWGKAGYDFGEGFQGPASDRP